ncbi:MAG: glycosyltransferase, partial [Candidatus Zixiibacteriota bacterium]
MQGSKVTAEAATPEQQRKTPVSIQPHANRDTSRKIKKSALVVLTLNAGADFARWLHAVLSQTAIPERLILIDSSSDDDTVNMAQEAGFEVHVIDRREFNHGATRQMAVEMLPEADVIVFLTQDAVLAHPQALERLLVHFEDPRVGAVYGRQLPRQGAGPIEAHARLFNYPTVSGLRSAEDVPKMGIKTSFISNSFAAWRRRALMEVGGFPSHTIQNE